MGIRDIIEKAFKPTGGSAFFESFGVPAPTNATDNINAYKGVVYACVSAIAEEVGKIEIKTYKGDKEVNSPLLSLLFDPNPAQRMTQYNLFELTQTYMELSGECFWYLATGDLSKQPKQVIILRPDRMNVAIDKEGGVKGYTYTKDDGVKVPFELSEIIHFKMPNPRNPYRGMGTVEAGMIYIQTEEFASQWTRNALHNDARPSGIVSLKGTIDQKTFDAVKRMWKKEYGGVSNANKTAILKQMDVDYTKVGVGLDEVAIKELKNLTRDDVMFMFRVSKPILGITEDVNLSNAKTSHYIFMQRVIKPKMDRIVDTLQASLGKYYEVEIRCEDPVEEDDMEKANYYEKMLNVGMTINEIRTEEGLDPIQGGDSIYQPMNLVPIGEVQRTEPHIKVTRTTKKKKEVTKPAEKVDKKLIHWKNLNKIFHDWLPKYEKAVNKVLNMQEKDVIAKIKPNAKKDTESYKFDQKKYAEVWQKELLPIVNELFIERAEYSASMVGAEFAMNDQYTKDLSARIFKVFSEPENGFDKQTADKISKTLIEGMLENESVAKLADRITGVYSEAKGYRAELVSRTETKHTAEKATLEAYKQSAVVTGKQWFANPGACGFCKEMDGAIVDVNVAFKDLGSEVSYTDEEGVLHSMGIDYETLDTSDLHPNCECETLPYMKEWEE